MEDRKVKKAKKRIGKKVELLLLIGLINKNSSYNLSIFIREILKNNKVNITLIDLVV